MKLCYLSEVELISFSLARLRHTKTSWRGRKLAGCARLKRWHTCACTWPPMRWVLHGISTSVSNKRDMVRLLRRQSINEPSEDTKKKNPHTTMILNQCVEGDIFISYICVLADNITQTLLMFLCIAVSLCDWDWAHHRWRMEAVRGEHWK